MMRKQIFPSSFAPLALIWMLSVALIASSYAQTAENERIFPESKATVEKALKELRPFTSGHLPTLDGFALSDSRPLDRFQQGYFQCSVQITSRPSGGSLVQVSAKITAWYAAPVQSQSSYQVLASNGRLESDLLDRLQQALQHESAGSPRSPATSQPASVGASRAPVVKSAPATSSMPDAPSASATGQVFRMGTPSQTDVPSAATQKAVVDRHMEELQTEAKNLSEILRNQSHPTNLVAVKKEGAPILATPNEGSKVLFQASPEDEFELLDENASWVHVRISGLSRGWIARSQVQMSGDVIPDTAQLPAQPSPAPAGSPAKTANAAVYQVEHEEIASFPGTWGPLSGKTVKIISVQPTLPTGGDSQAKLDYAKSVFNTQYKELTANQTTAAGLVIIFDSADGGMLAATLPVLKQWKDGTLSEAAMWRRCYVDPPEMLSGLIKQ
jgi:hypothetical protein